MSFQAMSLEVCAAAVAANPNCGDAFSYRLRDWCDCVPREVVGPCTPKANNNYNTYRVVRAGGSYLSMREHPRCDEAYSGAKGVGYRGCQTTTRGGHTCQMWSVQAPHTHDLAATGVPVPGGLAAGHLDMGIGAQNYCRNPGGAEEARAFSRAAAASCC